ncbi:MAG TPA: hypothetical protein VFD48_08005 [Pyrinomonadaceae bacterium]|nr:hypothetical protein [Pyrinomonadaceae bacterium]
MKVLKLTIVLLVLVCATLGLTFGRQNQTQNETRRETEYAKQLQARRLRFPTADYHEPDLPDPKKNEALKQKKLRKNTYKLVARNPPDWQSESVASNEGELDFPALPVVESAYIVLGKVTSAEAHLSENKKNVYSEFKVSVEKVFKTASSSISEGTEIVVDRIGGFVKHPNGHTVLYRISGMNMPLKGERYLLFLTSTNHQDLSILTAYELGVNGTSPLDEWAHFEKYRGVTEESLVQSLRDSLTKSSPY